MDNDLRRKGESDWQAFERGVDAALASGPKHRPQKLNNAKGNPSKLALRQFLDARIAEERGAGGSPYVIVQRVIRHFFKDNVSLVSTPANGTAGARLTMVVREGFWGDFAEAADYVWGQLHSTGP